MLKLRVTRDGRPVTDLQPYLGAYGHLVALRGGDLAYLHVHPDGEPGRREDRAWSGGRVRRRGAQRRDLPPLPRLQARRRGAHGPVPARRDSAGEMTTQATPDSSTELDITGMTCAACANRIERKLNKVPGVTATVNYATEKAKVSHGGDVATDDLVAVVESAGYGARLPAPPATAGRAGHRRRPGAAPAPAAAGLPRADRAGGGDGDGPGLAVHQLAVAVAHPGRAGRGVGGAPVPPCRVGQPAARQLDDGHPDLDGHAGGLRLVALRPVLRYGGRTRHDPPVRADRPAQRRRGQHLPRSGCGCHDVHPRRAVLRGPVEATGRCGHARAARAGFQGRLAAPGRRGDAGADRAARGGRPVRRTPRGEGRHRRRGRGRFLRRRRLDAHRGVGAGRGGRRGHRRRRDRQRRRAARRTRHPGRRGHPARPDGPAGRGRPERQGRGPAAG